MFTMTQPRPQITDMSDKELIREQDAINFINTTLRHSLVNVYKYLRILFNFC